jgi:RNA polymerase sigma-70 factor (ECF subfamily)
VRLADQDRGRWDRALAAEGRALVRECLRVNRPGPYQLQAAIQAVHSDALSAADTDWRQVVQLYDRLYVLTPTPVIALNRATALAEVEGPEAALAIVDGLPLAPYYLFHAVRADLLARMGRTDDARAAYDEAVARTENDTQREFLREARGRVVPQP